MTCVSSIKLLFSKLRINFDTVLVIAKNQYEKGWQLFINKSILELTKTFEAVSKKEKICNHFFVSLSAKKRVVEVDTKHLV